MNGHTTSCRKLLVADMALKVLSFLVLHQYLLVVKFPIAVVTPHLGSYPLLLLSHYALRLCPPSLLWVFFFFFFLLGSLVSLSRFVYLPRVSSVFWYLGFWGFLLSFCDLWFVFYFVSLVFIHLCKK